MLKRLLRVSLSIFAFAVIIFSLAIVASIIGDRFHPDGTFDIYNLSNDPQVPSECRRHVGDFTINSEEDGDYLDYQWLGTQAQLESCTEAINAMSGTFDERDYVGSYEAGYVTWVGFDPTDIHDWDLPDECQPHYVFKSKSHPWWIDYLGTVDYIDVTFRVGRHRHRMGSVFGRTRKTDRGNRPGRDRNDMGRRTGLWIDHGI